MGVMSKIRILSIDSIVILLLAFSAFASYGSDSMNRIALYVAIPISLVLSILRYGVGRICSYYKYFILMLLWVFISVLWAKDSTLAMRQIQQLAGVFLICSTIIIVGQNNSNIPALYVVYMFIYVSMWNYIRQNLLGVIDISDSRMEDEKLNANMVAYYTFYFTFILFILGEILKSERIKRVLSILFFLMIPASFIIALLTASRQVLLIQIPLLTVLVYVRYVKGSSIIKKVALVLFASVVLALSLDYVDSVYQQSYLALRNEKELEDDVRVQLMKDSFHVGVDHFFTGVGAGNYVKYSFDGHFSHNTFLELFANTGIIGAMLFIVMVFSFAIRQWRRYLVHKDRMFLFFFVFGVFFILDQFFYVFYTKLWLMGFFFLVATHSDNYFRLSTFNKRINN